MKPATSLERFIAAPAGTTFAAKSFILCAPSTERMVVSHLGSLEQADYALVQPLVAMPNSPGLAPRYDLVYDVSAVETMDRPTFTAFETFVQVVLPVLEQRLRTFALALSHGLLKQAFSGMFHNWIAPKLPHARMYDTRDAALASIGMPDDERAAIVTALDAFARTSPLVRQMREVLARDLAVSTLDAVAAKLGTSARSLQRHLAEVGTSFRDELARARVRTAQELLVDTEQKIEAIATELGFKSVAAFTTMFRAAVGDTPAAYREARKPRP